MRLKDFPQRWTTHGEVSQRQNWCFSKPPKSQRHATWHKAWISSTKSNAKAKMYYPPSLSLPASCWNNRSASLLETVTKNDDMMIWQIKQTTSAFLYKDTDPSSSFGNCCLVCYVACFLFLQIEMYRNKKLKLWCVVATLEWFECIFYRDVLSDKSKLVM